jgi:pantoate--beta-alanine ligase
MTLFSPLVPIKKSKNLRSLMKDWGNPIGLIPTMGALHEGHLQLIRHAANSAEEVVVSIFVNPTQFAGNEDLESYPRNLASDIKMAQLAGATQIFAPTVKDLYPIGFSTYVVPCGPLIERWEGKSRPHFFRGVCTVVCKLFQIIQPTFAIFGQKDFQQLQVVRQMVSDLDLQVEIKAIPTVREEDGLAMSSRNTFLDAKERKVAPLLFQTLQQATVIIQNDPEQNLEVLSQGLTRQLNAVPQIKIDYLSFVDAESLQPVSQFNGNVCLMVAAFVGNTRLIDNLLIQT